MTRDNLMLRPPNDPFRPEPRATVMASPTMGTSTMLFQDDGIGFFKGILLSVALHASIVAVILLLLLILEFFGIDLLTFNRPERVKDLVFQLVDAPTEKPTNPKTRNRAQHDTRAHSAAKNRQDAQPQALAGQPKPQQKPTPPQPKQAQQPRAVAPKQPQHKQAPTKAPQPFAKDPSPAPPAPPRPRVTAPKMTPRTSRVTTAPNPLAPIKAPSAPAPANSTGPLVRSPMGGGGSPSGSGSTGSMSSVPATLPGQFSSGGRPGSSNSPVGQGGSGNYSQFGSPGGRAGRPGVDAIGEPDFSAYLSELQRRIRRNWRPPDDKEDKSVILLFVIAKDGRLLSIKTQRSSGFADADNAARAAVEQSAPFRPLPAEFRNNTISVDFTFDYKVFSGSSGGIHRRY